MDAFQVLLHVARQTGSVIAIGAFEGLFDVRLDGGIDARVTTRLVHAPFVVVQAGAGVEHWLWERD